MSDRVVSMIVQVGGAVRNQYLRSLTTAEQYQKRLTGALQGTKKQLGAVAAARDYERRLQELRRRQDAAGESSEELSAEIRQVNEQYEGARRSARLLGADVGDLAGEHRRLAREAERTEKRLKSFQARQEAGAALRRQWASTAALAGTVYGAGRVVASAGEREQQALYLETAFNPTVGGGDVAAQVGDAVEAIRSDVRHRLLAPEAELLDISYALHSAGLDDAASRAGTSIVHKVAKVTRGESTQVGETVATAFNVLGPRAEESAEEAMQRIGGVLARAQLKFQFRDFGQLGEGMNYAISSSAAYRVSLEQTAVALGVLNTGGVTGSRAGTAYAAVLRNLGKASRELGFELKRDADGMLDLVGTMEALDRATAHMDTDARAAAFQETFGDEGRAGLQPMLEMLGRLRDGLKDLGDPAIGEAIEDLYDKFLDSSGGRWQRARQNIQQVGEAWARTVRPWTNALAEGIARVGAAVADTLDRYPKLGKAVAGVAVAYGGLKAAMLGSLVLKFVVPGVHARLVGSFAAVGRATWRAGAAMTGFAGSPLASLRAGAVATAAVVRAAGAAIAGFGHAAWGVGRAPIPAMGRALGALRGGVAATATAIRVAGLAFLTSPIGWVVGGIALAAGLIIRYWQPVKAFFGGFFAGVKEGFGPLSGILGRVVGWVGQAVKWFLNLFKPVDASAEALAGAANAGKAFGRVIGSALKIITAPLGAVLEALGWIGIWVGKAVEWAFSPGDALEIPQDEQPSPRGGPPRRPAPAVAAAVAAGLTLPAAAAPIDTNFRVPVEADLRAPSDVGAAVAGVALPAAVEPPDTDFRVPVEADLRPPSDVGAAAAGLTLPAAAAPLDTDFRVPVEADLRPPSDVGAAAAGLTLPAAAAPLDTDFRVPVEADLRPPSDVGAAAAGLTLPAAAAPLDTDFRVPVEADLRPPSDVGAAVAGLTLPAAVAPLDTDFRVPVEADLRPPSDVGAAAAGLTLPAAAAPLDTDFRVPVEADLRPPSDVGAAAAGLTLPAAAAPLDTDFRVPVEADLRPPSDVGAAAAGLTLPAAAAPLDTDFRVPVEADLRPPSDVGAAVAGLTLPAAVAPLDTDFRVPVEADLRPPSDVGAAAAGLTLPAAAAPLDTDFRVPVEADLRPPSDVGAAVAGLTLPAAVEVPETKFQVPVDLRLPADIGLPAATAERVQSAPARTVHQTIHIGPIYVQAAPGEDVDALVDEIERRLDESLRRASADAALAEDDLP